VGDSNISDLNHPEGLKYGPEHEWSSIGDDGIVTVGITDFAQDQLGDIEYVELPSPGLEVEKGAAFAEVESTKTASDVYAPCSGEIVEVNDRVVSRPEQMNSDPYAAWLVRIRPNRPEELDQLLDAAGYLSRL
jgi:glycine cleavage system H protein